MSYFSYDQDKRQILSQVLTEYKLITDAPLSLEAMPGYSSDFSAEELSRFKAKAYKAERVRKYKVCDSDGNIYLVANPWARKIETREDGTTWVIHPQPILVMTFSEAKQQAARAATNSNDDTDQVAKTSSDSEFDY